MDERRIAEIRNKINAENIVKQLEKHINDETKMESTQVTAALGLLRKCVPDVANVDISGELEGNLTIQITKYADDSSTK